MSGIFDREHRIPCSLNLRGHNSADVQTFRWFSGPDFDLSLYDTRRSLSPISILRFLQDSLRNIYSILLLRCFDSPDIIEVRPHYPPLAESMDTAFPNATDYRGAPTPNDYLQQSLQCYQFQNVNDDGKFS